jgi:hypothetical protein
MTTSSGVQTAARLREMRAELPGRDARCRLGANRESRLAWMAPRTRRWLPSLFFLVAPSAHRQFRTVWLVTPHQCMMAAADSC